MKVHPRILLHMMFAFKQKWLYEESVVAHENPNFKAMEKLLIDWVTVYNKSKNVFYVKENNGVAEPVPLDATQKAQVINRILETFMNVTNDFRTGVARQFSQQIQQSQILNLFEEEVLRLDNAALVNPFFNNFARIVGSMINQEPTLVNRYLKVEKKLVMQAAIVQQPEEAKEPVSTFDEPAQQQDTQMQEEAKPEPKPVIEQETEWDEDALIPKILRRYIASVPNDKETAYNVVKLLGYISVTQQGKSLISELGSSLLLKALTFSVDIRLEFPDQALQLERDYVVGLAQTMIQQRISPESLT